MAGKFHVRLDCRPNGKSTAFDFHVKCNSCRSILATFTAHTHEDREIKRQEAHKRAVSQEHCDHCDRNKPVPIAAGFALDATQMN